MSKLTAGIVDLLMMGIYFFIAPSYRLFDNFIILFIFLVFFLLGIYLVFSALYDSYIKKKIDLEGIEVYGKIINISTTGVYINDIPQLKATVRTYLPKTGTVECFNAVIGLSPSQYRVGDYLKVKYYNGNINIIEIADEKYIPSVEYKQLNDSERN